MRIIETYLLKSNVSCSLIIVMIQSEDRGMEMSQDA